MRTNDAAALPAERHLSRDELYARYRQERDKRLRSDGMAQYLPPTGRFQSMLDDPYVAATPREPVFDDVTVVIIGAGFGGLVTGARLRESGVSSIRLIESGGDVGGVWYWNRYPGAMCDTAATVYLPLLEETRYVPSMKYTSGQENLDHARRIARHYGLYEDALFSTEVSGVVWDAATARWIVRTNHGDEIRAQFIAMGTGPLHRPKLPGIPGLETFAGRCFHTARWDYAYTGGDPSRPQLDLLGDKRVGIIGTGATAVQCVPPLARAAKELFVFQRTPSSIDVRGNRPLEPHEFADLEPGWQQRYLLNFATLQTGQHADEDLVQDGWTDISQRIRSRLLPKLGKSRDVPLAELIQQAYEDSDDEKMNEIRARVAAVVRDRATAEALQPWYRQLCKRPCFHDEYLDAFNEPSAHLVDTNGKGVTRVDATGAWVGDSHYELDCLILASGFEIHFAPATQYETIGRDGLALSVHWSDGMRSLHGLQVHGFPNLFIIGMNQAGNLVANITHNLQEAAATAAAVISHAVRLGAETVEPTAAAEASWVGLIEGSSAGFLGSPDCTPGYYNNEGQPISDRDRRNASGYPDGPVAFFTYIDQWRSRGDFDGVEFGWRNRRARPRDPETDERTADSTTCDVS